MATVNALSAVLNQHVEAAKLLADTLRRCRNRFMISNIELHSMGIRADAFCGRLALLEIARSNQNREAVWHEVFRDLKADTLIGAGDECDRFSWHGDFLLREQLLAYRRSGVIRLRTLRVLTVCPGCFSRSTRAKHASHPRGAPCDACVAPC
jgi:hypothetical protein